MERKKIIIYKENITANELQRVTSICPKEFLEQLNIKEPISLEDFKILSEFMEFNFVAHELSKEENLRFFAKSFPSSTKKVVVSIMGHVNHGKTTLIDKIRNTRVAQGEVGGITQNVSFYNIKYNGQDFILIDTPGHAVFSDLRKIIVEVSDIIILIVAADDGVQEQTREIAKNISDKNIIICINKIDKGEKNLSKIYSDLANLHIVSKNFGGDVETISISAQKQEGIDQLLDSIVHEIKVKRLKNDSKRLAIGIVVDATVKEGIGIIVQVLLQQGIMKVKDFFICGNNNCRVKTILLNNKVVQVCHATEIVSIVGFNSIPTIGSKIYIVPDSSFKEFLPEIIPNSMRDHKKEINFICKSDQESKLQTLIDLVGKYGNVIDSSIGVLKKTEIDQAKTFKAILVFWQSLPSSFTNLLSQYPEVKYIQDEVIYQIEQQINKLNEKPPEEKLVIIGKLKVIKTFFIKGKNIAGCKVVDGFAQIGCKCSIKRNDEEIMSAKIDSLQKDNKDVEKAKKDTECGIVLGVEKSNVQNIEIGDEIIVFEK